LQNTDSDDEPWVFLDFRNQKIEPGLNYLSDAMLECRHRFPRSRILVLGQEFAFRESVNNPDVKLQVVSLADFRSELHALMQFAAYKVHIVVDRGLGYWAALLSGAQGTLTVAPMQLYAVADKGSGEVSQPVWPNKWVVIPTRLNEVPFSPDSIPAVLAVETPERPIRVGVTGCYEHIVSKNYLFRTCMWPMVTIR